ncbi:hypothetical protein FL857_10855 [Criibacterium bergeronii]|uniref:Uncharacterized protein n=1 Tax=Criibacterium bergeronii TaxID=1871336 RepID=A0A552UXD8_9FIRM|nr:hypothetical protein [Criibacterium bergeronii]TRW22901.1 hypothetical protein FL857_10855 [Criibacterium bergeronii]
MEYGFKVIARIKDDLNIEEREKITEKIEYLKNILGIYQVDDETYIRVRTNNRDFAKACGFYYELKDEKNDFSKLEYYDYIDDEMEIAV